MNRRELVSRLKPLSEYLSESHGDHEGGYAGNCQFCALVALVEIMGGVIGSIDINDWDEEVADERPFQG